MSDPRYKVWARIEREHAGEYEDIGEPVQLGSFETLVEANAWTVEHDEHGGLGAFLGWTVAQIEESEMHAHGPTALEALIEIVESLDAGGEQSRAFAQEIALGRSAIAANGDGPDVIGNVATDHYHASRAAERICEAEEEERRFEGKR